MGQVGKMGGKNAYDEGGSAMEAEFLEDASQVGVDGVRGVSQAGGEPLVAQVVEDALCDCDLAVGEAQGGGGPLAIIEHPVGRTCVRRVCRHGSFPENVRRRRLNRRLIAMRLR